MKNLKIEMSWQVTEIKSVEVKTLTKIRKKRKLKINKKAKQTY